MIERLFRFPEVNAVELLRALLISFTYPTKWEMRGRLLDEGQFSAHPEHGHIFATLVYDRDGNRTIYSRTARTTKDPAHETARKAVAQGLRPAEINFGSRGKSENLTPIMEITVRHLTDGYTGEIMLLSDPLAKDRQHSPGSCMIGWWNERGTIELRYDPSNEAAGIVVNALIRICELTGLEELPPPVN